MKKGERKRRKLHQKRAEIYDMQNAMGGGMVAGGKIENEELGEKNEKGKEKRRGKLHKKWEKKHKNSSFWVINS